MSRKAQYLSFMCQVLEWYDNFAIYSRGGGVTLLSKIRGYAIQMVKVPPINPEKFFKNIPIDPEKFIYKVGRKKGGGRVLLLYLDNDLTLQRL